MKPDSNTYVHVANPETGEFFHMDELHRIYTCPCMLPHDKKKISLCITLCDCLLKEGELRELDRQIAQKRKLLGLKYSDAMPEIL